MKPLPRNPTHRRPAGENSRRARWFVGLLLLLLVLPTPAQPTSPPPTSGGRFLFLVDTSLAMQRRAEGVAQAVEALFGSGLDGRLQAGDTIGLWTFNADVHAGHFPLQTWSPAARRTVTDNVLEFLKRQHYGKRADLDKVLTKAAPLVRHSKSITLVLMTDGEASVRGTPFDAAINATFRELGSEQRRLRMPFVTVLHAEAGQFVNYTVGQPPWPVKIPMLPGEERALAAKMAPPPKAPPVASVEPSPAITAKPAETEPALNPTGLPQASAGAANPASAATLNPAVAEELPVSQPAPEKPATPPPAPATEPPTAAAKAETPTVSTGKPDSPVSVTPQPGVQAEPGAPTPSTGVADAAPKPSPSTETGTPLAEAGATTPAVSGAKPPGTESPLPAPSPAGSPKPAEVTPAPPSKPIVAATEAKPSLAPPDAESPPSKSGEILPVESGPVEVRPTLAQIAKPATDAPVPVQAAAALAPQPFLSGRRLLILGLLLMAAAGVLFFLIVRRSRVTAPHASLITQSFDRDRRGPGPGAE